MSVSLSVMALRELPFGRFRMPRRHEVTHEEATDAMNDSWVLNYEREGVAIRDVLAGRIRVSGFALSSQLHMVIDLIFTFFDKERENWTRWKHRYARMEKNFARTLFNVICAVKLNTDFSVGAKPPIDRVSYYKLMTCWGFEPFQDHLSERKKRTVLRHLRTIMFYFETLNPDGQAEMTHQIVREDELKYSYAE